MMTIKKSLIYVTVEPVVFFTFAGLTCYQLVRDTGLYQIICSRNYVPKYKNLNCKNTTDFPEVEDQIQKEATLWIMLCTMAIIGPAMVTDLLMSAWGDKNGRKLSMLLGMAGTIVSIIPLIVLFTFPHLPIYMVVACNLICGVTGSVAIVLISAYAFLADTVKDRTVLTIRMGILAVALAAGQTTGTYLAGKLLDIFTLPQCAIAAVLLHSTSFFYCLIRIPNTKPNFSSITGGDPRLSLSQDSPTTTLMQRGQKQTPDDTNDPHKKKTNIFREAGNLLNQIKITFFKPRKGYRRCFLLVGIFVFFISTLTDFHQSVMTLFAYHRPLNWTPEQLGMWKAVDNILELSGNLIGIVVLKKLLKFADTTVVLLSLVTCAAHHVIIALSTKTWMVYTAAGVGMLCHLVPPTISSFTTHLISSDEVGKTFGGYAVAGEVALITATLSFNSIYSLTVSFFPGFVFFVMTGLIGLAVLIMIWVHFKAKSEENADQDRATNNDLQA